MPRRAGCAGRASPAADPTRHGCENADHPRSGGPASPGRSRQARRPRQPSSSRTGPAEAGEHHTRCHCHERPARPNAAPPPHHPGRTLPRGVVRAQAPARRRDPVAHLVVRRRPRRGWAARAENAASGGTARPPPCYPSHRSRGRARPMIGVPRPPLERHGRPVVPIHPTAGPDRAPPRASNASRRDDRRALLFPPHSGRRLRCHSPGSRSQASARPGSSLRRAAVSRAGSDRPR